MTQITDKVRRHYEEYPYPRISLLAKVRRCDTYALNAFALLSRFNGEMPKKRNLRILLAGCGSFSPYTFSLANPDAEITALDLSAANLRRARLHAFLNGCRNITYINGDLICPETAPGPFDLIDAYGVLHHLEAPLAGLAILAKRLADGGVLRLMVYSKAARREIESVRRAFRFIGVGDVAAIRRIFKRAPEDSRLGRCWSEMGETDDAGIADAFLHPCARTFTIDELTEMVEQAALTPLLYANKGGSSPDTPHNYILYAGKNTRGSADPLPGKHLLLNPVLEHCVGWWRLFPAKIDDRLGFENPLIDMAARRFLRRFRKPVAVSDLTNNEIGQAIPFINALFLMVC